jgi:hypothetical protein
MLKKESAKLRMEEVDEFKVITEQERFREKKKIIEKHRHIEDSLQSK